MMKFSALNESSLSEDDGDPELATREAQEEEAYSIYHSALRKQYEGQLKESEELFKELLEMEFLTLAQLSEEKPSAPLGPALTLKYLVYKNLAMISKEKEDYHASVSFYLEALEIDSSDVMMWYHMGKSSLKISNYSLARLCFEEGLKCSPNHWPCLDNVISVMYTLNDYANCLYYIAQALERETYYLKGLAFKDQIYKEDPSLKTFCDSYFKKCDPSIHHTEYDKEEAEKFIQECLEWREKKRSFYKPKPLPILALGLPIKENTWKNLGDSLVNMYDCIANANPCVSFSCKVDLSPYLENPNEMPELSCDKIVAPSSLSSLSEAFSSNSVPPLCNTRHPNEACIQLAPSLHDPIVSEMEVDEAPNISKSVNPDTITLPQAEIQPTDLSIYSDSTSNSKRTKRKRNDLAELSDFVSKRRSTRVRNPTIKRPQDNTNYQELLHKFLPAKLIGNGKFDEQDYDSDQISQDKSNSDHTYISSADKDKKDLFNSICSTEKEEVYDFITKNQSNGGIIDLLYKYVVILGSKSNLNWPKLLIDVYCSAFLRLRKHITAPNLFSHSTEPFRIKELGLAILVFCEFKVDQFYQNSGHSLSISLKISSGSGFPSSKIGSDFYEDMEFLIQLISRTDVLNEEWLNYTARALWLKAKFHSLEGEIDLAVSCMGKLFSVLSDEASKDVKIVIQNCNNSNSIAIGNVQQQLESLQRCQSLEEVQRLYEHGDYAAVVDLLVLTFNQPRASKKQSVDGVPERHAQLLFLQNSLLKLERYKECVFWSEVSFNEALQQFMNATKNSEWSETMAQLLSGLDKCVKLDLNYLNQLDDSKLARLTQNLILVIVIQMENYDFAGDNAALLVVLPWIILYRLILNEEVQDKKKSESATDKRSLTDITTAANDALTDTDLSSSMPASLMLLFAAHEYLGRRSWCTACDGLLLLTFIDIMMAGLQDTKDNSSLYREDLETGLEQCIYCLFGHPNKRSRAKHLTEHYAKQIILTWERACLIYQYFKPNILPEFDSYRTSTISTELESLFRRISMLVSPDEDPSTRVDPYTAYIEGGTDKCPDAPFRNKKISFVVKDLYYLLGDYYFKNKDFSKAIRYYLYDICINPDRQDSWAGMALSRSSQLDQKLTSYELRNESTIYRKSSAALRCFDHALELDPTTTSLWIEYGSLAYILHSHASRQLKQETFCEELHDLLKKKEMEMLEVAERCFREANRSDDGSEPEEAWLHHYMLGKISEKKGDMPSVYLDHYRKALNYLHEDFARYPQKILYHNPAEMSIEALEVYYRVHASCIKFLWKYESIGFDLGTTKFIQQFLHTIKTSPFYKFQEKSRTEIAGSSSNAASEAEDIQTCKVVESLPRVDHNYYGNADKAIKKISEDTRSSRPSTDSLPESQDLLIIKELIDSLVIVVAERFIDEAKEKAIFNDSKRIPNVTEKKQDSLKVIIESIAEESVYTTKDSVEKLKETDQISQIISSVQEPMIIDEMDEFAKLQELAKELETKAASFNQSSEWQENSIVTNSQTKDNLVTENAITSKSSINLNKDDEVLMSLSSILSSLEAINKTDADHTKEKQIKIEMCNRSLDVVGNDVADKIDNPNKPKDSLESVNSNLSVKLCETKLINDVLDSNSSKEISITNISKLDLSDEVNKFVENENKSSSKEENAENANRSEEKINLSDTCDKLVINQCKDPMLSNDKDILDRSDSKPEKQPKYKMHDAHSPAPTPEDLRKSRAEILKLIPKCLDAMRECLQRFPQHYKALYRLAHYFCHSTCNQNLQWAREILLAATPATKKYPPMAGLFAERKNTNFFNGIWRAPSNEIDRAGSFGAHMYRSVYLLIEVLTKQNDYNMLVYVTQQLYRTPDLGKKYMRDTDRVFLVRKAYDACVNILREKINSLLQEEPPPEESQLVCCLLEIYRTCLTLWKAGINVEDTNDLLEHAYTMYRIGEVDSHPSVLEQATKFCQIQLSKTYPQPDLSKPGGGSSKHQNSPDVIMLQGNTSLPSASGYNPDAWQKELAESLMMPILPCEGRSKTETTMTPEAKPIKSEILPIQDSLPVLIPIESNFNSAASTVSNIPQNPAISPQMVHVEKPKAENLQACSVAFLPVAPVYQKESINIPQVFQTPPLLSCQAFESFDVLTSIMQASGYQVNPQMGVQQTFNPGLNIYDFKPNRRMNQMQHPYSNYPPKMWNMRLGRKRRRGRPYRLEGLNLSKKLHTKPIVSTTIANSITQLKVEGITASTDTRNQPEPTQSLPLCLVKPKSIKRIPCYKANVQGTIGLDLSQKSSLDLSKKSSDSATSAKCSVIVSTSETLKSKMASDYQENKSLKKEKKIVSDMLPDIYDFTDDSNLSTNLEASRIEKCAKEMLKFMNQKIDDPLTNDQPKEIISSKKQKFSDALISEHCKDLNSLKKQKVKDLLMHAKSKEVLPLKTLDSQDLIVNNQVKEMSTFKYQTNDNILENDMTKEILLDKNINIKSLLLVDQPKEMIQNTNQDIKDPFLNDQTKETLFTENTKNYDPLVSNETLLITKQITEDSLIINQFTEICEVKEESNNILLVDKFKENFHITEQEIEKPLINEKCIENIQIKKQNVGDSLIIDQSNKIHLTKEQENEDNFLDNESKQVILSENEETDNSMMLYHTNEMAIKNEINKEQFSLNNKTEDIISTNDQNVENTLINDNFQDITFQISESAEEFLLNEQPTKILSKCQIDEDCFLNNQNREIQTSKHNKVEDIILDDKIKEVVSFIAQTAEIYLTNDKSKETFPLKNKKNEDSLLTDQTETPLSLKKEDITDCLLKKSKNVLNFVKQNTDSYSQNNKSEELVELDSRKVDDPLLNDQFTADISIPKSEMDGIFKLLEVENDRDKDIHVNSLIYKIDNNNENMTDIENKNEHFVDDLENQIKSVEDKTDASIDIGLLESINALNKDSGSEFTLFFPKLNVVNTDNEKNKNLILQKSPVCYSTTSETYKEINKNDDVIENPCVVEQNQNNAFDIIDENIKTENNNVKVMKDSKDEETKFKTCNLNDQNLFMEYSDVKDFKSSEIHSECNIYTYGYFNESKINYCKSNENNSNIKSGMLEFFNESERKDFGCELKNLHKENEEPCLELTVEYNTENERDFCNMEDSTDNSTDTEYDEPKYDNSSNINKNENANMKSKYEDINIILNDENFSTVSKAESIILDMDKNAKIIPKDDRYLTTDENITPKTQDISIIEKSENNFVIEESLNIENISEDEYILPIIESIILTKENTNIMPKIETTSFKNEKILQNNDNILLNDKSIDIKSKHENFVIKESILNRDQNKIRMFNHNVLLTTETATKEESVYTTKNTTKVVTKDESVAYPNETNDDVLNSKFINVTSNEEGMKIIVQANSIIPPDVNVQPQNEIILSLSECTVPKDNKITASENYSILSKDESVITKNEIAISENVPFPENDIHILKSENISLQNTVIPNNKLLESETFIPDSDTIILDKETSTSEIKTVPEGRKVTIENKIIIPEINTFNPGSGMITSKNKAINKESESLFTMDEIETKIKLQPKEDQVIAKKQTDMIGNKALLNDMLKDGNIISREESDGTSTESCSNSPKNIDIFEEKDKCDKLKAEQCKKIKTGSTNIKNLNDDRLMRKCIVVISLKDNCSGVKYSDSKIKKH